MILTASRAAARVLVASVLVWGVSVLLAGPAAAEVPEGWPENPPVDLLEALLLIGGVSLLVLLVVTVATVGPALARGESIAPGVSAVEDQWLGGPRDRPELSAPQRSERSETPAPADSSDSSAGGASARW